MGCATPLLLAGCAGELSALDPAGPRAESLARLWWVMLAGAGVLLTLVMALFALACLAPGTLGRLSPRHWILGGGLALPLPVLVLLTGTALVLGEQLLARGETPWRISAEAMRWSWRFSYPDRPDIAPGPTLHMPAGVPVDILVSSRDVVHSFWVPRLGGKIDAVPGHVTTLRLEADEPGTYLGVCAEYCGVGHEAMPIRIEAHAPEDFARLFQGDAP